MSGNPAIVGEGFFGVLRKPFNLREMAEVVAAAVDRGKASSA
jgi:hypothetical protein